MKYASITKTDRNEEIVWLHRLRPELSLQEISNRYGISKQRISAILKRAEALKATK